MDIKKILIIAVAVSIIIYLLFKRKKSTTKSTTMETGKFYEIIPSKTGNDYFTPATEQDIKNALLHINEKYGQSIAQIVEKMFRLETANFTSTVFKMTNGAGVITSPTSKLFEHRAKLSVYVKPLYKNGKLVKNIFTDKNDPAAKRYIYVIFPTILEGMEYLANYIKKFGDKAPERWSGGAYNLATLNKIKTKYV